MADQRYVSKELSHFVGRVKSEEEQYGILLQILREGILLAPSSARVGGEAGEPLRIGYELVTNPAEPIGERFRANVVCFCDIPVEDLTIHTAKYSRFGLAFEKDFLVERGASPVFYIDTRATTIPGIHALRGTPAPARRSSIWGSA